MEFKRSASAAFLAWLSGMRWSVSHVSSRGRWHKAQRKLYLTAARFSMCGVTLLRMSDVLSGGEVARSPRSPRACGETSPTVQHPHGSAEESKACSADLCRPESGATKEQQKAMARRITSHHSIYFFFGRRGRLLLSWLGVGLRLAVRRSSPWSHAFSPTLTTSGQVTSSPLFSMRASRLPISS